MPGPNRDVEKIFNSVQAVSSLKRQGSQVSAGAHRRSHSDQPKAGYAYGLSSSMQRGVRYPRERDASNPCDHPVSTFMIQKLSLQQITKYSFSVSISACLKKQSEHGWN